MGSKQNFQLRTRLHGDLLSCLGSICPSIHTSIGWNQLKASKSSTGLGLLQERGKSREMVGLDLVPDSLRMREGTQL